MDPQTKQQSASSDTQDRPDPTGRIRAALAAASAGVGTPGEVEHAARELVTGLRHDDELPEQVLIQIKRILADAGLRPTYTATSDRSTPVGTEAAIYRDVIAWSIRYYYEGRGTIE